MPRAPETLADRLRDRRREEPAVEVIVIDGPEAAAKAREEFEGGFVRNGRGNLVNKSWQRRTVLTVFERGDVFCWSISDGGDVRFSKGSFETEGDAVGALADEFEINLW